MSNNLDTPINNTPYSDEELEHFKKLLLEEREETMDQLEDLQENIEDVRALDEDEFSSQDHHPGDLGSEEEEKETTYILIEQTRSKLQEISAALDRIDKRTYGVCEDTGKKIQKERLKAIPYTRYSLEASKKDESSHPGPIGHSSRKP